jgi:hypothetical protein
MFNSIKKPMLALGICLSLSLSSVTALASSSGKVLFIARAEKGQIIKNKKNQFLLIMKKAHLAYFYDRPERKSGKIKVNQFVSDWSQGHNSFKSDNPNAAMLATSDNDHHAKNIREFVTLSAPIFNTVKNTLSFNITPLNAQKKLHPGKYKDVLLFIDDGSCTLGNMSSNCNVV